MTNFRYIKNLIWCVMTPTHNFVTRSKKHSYIQGSYMYYIRIRAAKKQTALISNYRRSVRFMTCRIPWWGAWQNVSCFVLMSRRSASLRSHRVFFYVAFCVAFRAPRGTGPLCDARVSRGLNRHQQDFSSGMTSGATRDVHRESLDRVAQLQQVVLHAVERRRLELVPGVIERFRHHVRGRPHGGRVAVGRAQLAGTCARGLPQPAQEHLGPVRTARLRAHTGEQKKTYTGGA